MTDDSTLDAGNDPPVAETDEIELTDEQRDALVLDRNVTITAGAGTGKTTTLTNRYLEFLRANPDATPKNVVTITFTRKAAAELETRVREEVYDELQAADSADEYARWRAVLDELDDGYTHTIHAFCARLLRENAGRGGIHRCERDRSRCRPALSALRVTRTPRRYPDRTAG
jgi:ATP-dependent exoDNAse (exonuclease V) beta subunit